MEYIDGNVNDKTGTPLEDLANEADPLDGLNFNSSV